MAEKFQRLWQHVNECCVNQAGNRDGAKVAVGSHDAVKDARAALGHKVGAIRRCRADQRSDRREGVPFLFGAAEMGPVSAHAMVQGWGSDGMGSDGMVGAQLGDISEEQDLWFVA